MKINVGIDLGTTYSAVATFNKQKGAVEILKNDLDKSCTPSVICIENGQVTIGEEAKTLQAAGNLNTAAFYKSMMGEKGYTLYLDDKDYTPEDLSAEYLRALKRNVEEANGVQIDGAVITVPAYFNEEQRTATMRAGQRAGLKVLKIINEPTSAIIAYGLTGQGKKNVMVYDLGGGTFDVTIAEVNGTKVRVITTNGNHQLGGKDWDLVLINELAQRFLDDYGVDLNDYPEEYKELQVKCEETKKKLTSLPSTSVTIQCEGYSGKYEVTREFFKEQTVNLLNETKSLIDRCFAEIGGGFGWHSLDEVVLVGGSTRMPQVKEMIIEEYGKPPITKNIDVDTIVASGAAMQAQLCTEDVLVLGGSAGAPTMSIGGSAGTVGNSGGLVIRGADIQDITAHSLGILVYDNDKEAVENSIIIKKGSEYNKYFGQEYFLSAKEIEIYVLQGESTNPYESNLLCKYVIETGNGGKPTKSLVELCYNNNGIVDVRAQGDSGSLRVSKVEVDSSSLREIIEDMTEKIKKARLPYSQWAGVSNIPTTKVDSFGNPQGSDYDLTPDGAFKGYKILVLDLCDGERSMDPGTPATRALEKKGFKVDIHHHVPGNLARIIDDYCQVWVVSDSEQRVSSSDVNTICDYYNRGHGVYLWGDNDPFYKDVNPIIKKLFGAELVGNYQGEQVLGIQKGPRSPGIVADHLITTGIVSFYEGITISHVDNLRNLKPLTYSSDGLVVSAYSDENERRALIDGGCTRLYCEWDKAGTDRYVVNAAAWLVNLERFGYNPKK